MRSMRIAAAGIALLAGVLDAHGLDAQRWNDSVARRLVARAVARRGEELADSGLRDYHARAHGFVFFLGQLGEGFNDPPKLIKTDQLESEVYWRAPGASKQRIIGWRDRADLPTDIRYHRDHLGIVQNGFASRIRIGEGDEVRDVPHPLSSPGDTLYDFAVADSLRLELPQRSIEVYELLVRPRDFNAPRVVGAVYLDVATAELVRFRFNFTRAAYLDATLEDITVVLENAIWGGRFWLPHRQEIEIRRRTEWLDLPARGIIRGRWEIDNYDLNLGLADSVFRGPEIVAAPPSVRDTFPWTQSLAASLTGVSRDPAVDADAVRAQIASLAAGHALNRLATGRPAAGSVSDLAHFNRVEGLALGAGYHLRLGDFTLGGWGSYGFADTEFKWRVAEDLQLGAWTIELTSGHTLRDVGDEPVVSGVVNSIGAQEGGYDFGDYVDLKGQALRVTRHASHGLVRLAFTNDFTGTATIHATPAWGTFRPNPALGDSAEFLSGTLDVEQHDRTLAGSGWSVSVGVTAGTRVGVQVSEPGFLRGRVSASVDAPVASTSVHLSGWAGAATNALPAYRTFVMGGRGTLLGEPFRAYGGREAAMASLEWRFPVPVPAIPLASLGSTGSVATLAPFLAVGWVGDPIAGTPWVATDGARPVAGAALELFHGLIRAEWGVGLRDGGVGFSIDLLRDLWPIL